MGFLGFDPRKLTRHVLSEELFFFGGRVSALLSDKDSNHQSTINAAHASMSQPANEEEEEQK